MKSWIFFVGGMAVGAGIGVLAVRNHYRKLAFDEINEVREYAKRKIASKEMADKNSEAKKALMNDISENSEEETGKTGTEKEKEKVYQKTVERYSGHFNAFTNPIDPSKIENSYEDDEEEDSDDPYEIFVNHDSPTETSDMPFLISEEEFASEKLFYDKVMLEYYDDGIAVLEDSNEIVESLEALIGPYILDRPIEDDTIYVRNDNRSTDYGIIFTGKTFVPEEGSD